MREVLISEIIDNPSSFITSKWIIERVPHLFNDHLIDYINWKEKLSKLIEVDSKSIVLTGSSAIGYSLNPYKNLKRFDNESDIDIAIISNYYFDVSWRTMRNMGTKIYKLNYKEKNALEDHRTRLIYWGTVATDKILQILPFKLQWINAIDQMKKMKPTLDKDINFRIYRDFESLKDYQNISVQKIKDELISGRIQ